MEGIQENFNNQYQRTKAVFDNVGGYLKEYVQPSTDWLNGKANYLVEVFQNAKTNIGYLASDIEDWGDDLGSDLKQRGEDLSRVIQEYGEDIGKDVTDWGVEVKTMFEPIEENVKELAKGVTDWGEEFGNDIKEWGMDVKTKFGWGDEIMKKLKDLGLELNADMKILMEEFCQDEMKVTLAIVIIILILGIIILVSVITAVKLSTNGSGDDVQDAGGEVDEHLNEEEILENEQVNIDKNGQHPLLWGVWYLIWAAIYVLVIMPISLTSCIFYLIFSPMSTLLPTLVPMTELFQAGVEIPEKVLNHLDKSTPQIDMALCIEWGEKVKTRMNHFIQQCQELNMNAMIRMHNIIQKCQEFSNNAKIVLNNFIQKCQVFSNNTKTEMNNFIQKCQEFSNNAKIGMNNFIQKCHEFSNNTKIGMNNFIQKCKEFGRNVVVVFHCFKDMASQKPS